jgi:membrane protease YdiL (CAAX protease family)
VSPSDMDNSLARQPISEAQGRRLNCWAVASLVGLGMPAAIWVTKKLTTLLVPAAVCGSHEQRYIWSILEVAIVEWLTVILLWFVLKARGSSFKDLGVWRVGTWQAWVLAVGVAALSIASNLRFLPRMHVPISNAFLPHGIHLVAALLMGTTAGFCEEVLFRAFLMTEFADAGYGKVMQVVMPGVSFGLAHSGYLSLGVMAWLGIMLPTALIGMIWGIAYLLGRRSLLPTIAAHFLNDATALPWISYFMAGP